MNEAQAVKLSHNAQHFDGVELYQLLWHTHASLDVLGGGILRGMSQRNLARMQSITP